MTVYVDEMCPYPRTKRWPFGEACHMWADTLAELHTLATAIDLRRAWFQDHPGFPHYDLTYGRRKAALECGAIEASLKEWIRKQIREELLPSRTSQQP